MIVSELSGGLGNQMFQIAAAFALSRDLNADLKVDLRMMRSSPRVYALGCFQTEFIEAKLEGYLLRNIRSYRSKIRHVLTTNPFCKRINLFEEKGAFVFDDRIRKQKGDIYLRGYYQTEKYFSHHAGEIRKLFTFRHESNGSNATFLKLIQEGQSVFVHIRRGDYVSNPIFNQHHGTCDLNYYQSAFELISERVRGATFFVFSDDLAWAKENVSPPGHTVFVSGNDGDAAAFEDLRLMSHCKHGIIANSSFSWWGAWLMTNPVKTVIAPKVWLRDQSVPVKDLIPTNWIAI